MASLRVFVSHSSKDNAWCDGFVSELKNHGIDAWYDREGLYVGDQWVQKLEQELQGRNIYLIVLSPDSWASPWVQRELRLALAQQKQIIGVYCKPTQVSGFITNYQLLDASKLDSLQAAQLVAAALTGAKSSLPPPIPISPTPFQPIAATPPRDGISGEWISEGNAKVELFLTRKGSKNSTYYNSIEGTGEHWLCGSV